MATGRKPVDAKSAKPTGRPAIWAAIRRMTDFTIGGLCRATDIAPKTIGGYVKALVAAGYVEEGAPADSGARTYRLVRDCGIEAPRVRDDGSEVVQGRATEQMWRTMRMAKTFTAADLAIQASTPDHPVAETHAADYCRHLAYAGYLRADGTGRGKRFFLIAARVSGPLPPQIQRVKQVWDPNLKQVVWPKEPRHG